MVFVTVWRQKKKEKKKEGGGGGGEWTEKEALSLFLSLFSFCEVLVDF